MRTSIKLAVWAVYPEDFYSHEGEVSGQQTILFQKLGFTVCTNDDKNPLPCLCLCRELPVGETG